MPVPSKSCGFSKVTTGLLGLHHWLMAWMTCSDFTQWLTLFIKTSILMMLNVFPTRTPWIHLVVIWLQLACFIAITCCLPTSSIMVSWRGMLQIHFRQKVEKYFCMHCINKDSHNDEAYIIVDKNYKIIFHASITFWLCTLSMWCKQTQESSPKGDQAVINRRNSFYYRMNRNKASVTALFRTLRSHCRPNKTWMFQPLFRIGGLCNTPCVAVMNIYSAVSTSHESELHNALCSAITPSQ